MSQAPRPTVTFPTDSDHGISTVSEYTSLEGEQRLVKIDRFDKNLGIYAPPYDTEIPEADVIAADATEVAQTHSTLRQTPAKLFNDFVRACVGKEPIHRRVFGETPNPRQLLPTLEIDYGTPNRNSRLRQFNRTITSTPRLWEEQRMISGCTLYDFQNALNTQATSPAQHAIRAAISKKLITAVFSFHQHHAHGDLKPENIIISYPPEQGIRTDLENLLTDSDANLQTFIDALGIELIDLDHARSTDSQLRYPRNGPMDCCWRPIGADSVKKERWILGGMILSLLAGETDYHAEGAVLMSGPEDEVACHERITTRFDDLLTGEGAERHQLLLFAHDLMHRQNLDRRQLLDLAQTLNVLNFEQKLRLQEDEITLARLTDAQRQVAIRTAQRFITETLKREQNPVAQDPNIYIQEASTVSLTQFYARMPTELITPKHFSRLYDKNAYRNVNMDLWQTTAITAFATVGIGAGINVIAVLGIVALKTFVLASAVCLPLLAATGGLAVLITLSVFLYKLCKQQRQRQAILENRPNHLPRNRLLDMTIGSQGKQIRRHSPAAHTGNIT